ncbi:L-rhamnose mutarotase [Actinacidiphila alni]|uniref:L-rhamnose mutarotase n=1 Tax=Actinacidiphila alni TaxID=380248 RepID=UPI002AFF0663|nr:L-rhamnose mutarotase [Actinacidiphila alni]
MLSARTLTGSGLSTADSSGTSGRSRPPVAPAVGGPAAPAADGEAGAGRGTGIVPGSDPESGPECRPENSTGIVSRTGIRSSTVPEHPAERKASSGSGRKGGAAVQRICFLMTVIEGREKEYQRRHDEIWPELVAALRDAGVRNYSLFRRGTTVIAYAECEPDAATAFGKVGATEVNARWSAWFQDVLAEHLGPDGGLIEAAEVWHMD